jgi:Mn-dependent DtxR family transcriptional regulator
MEVANMSANPWVKIISQNLHKKEDVVEKGYVKRSDLEKIWKVCKGSANQRLRTLINQGVVEQKKFKVRDSRGVFPVTHYKIK